VSDTPRTSAWWREKLLTSDLYGSLWDDIIADFAFEEKSHAVTREALAESERLRVEAGHDSDTFEAAYKEAEARSEKAEAERDDLLAYYETVKAFWEPDADDSEVLDIVARIEARRKEQGI
jgi:hypothetical protein